MVFWESSKAFKFIDVQYIFRKYLYACIIFDVHRGKHMEVREILQPKIMMIALGIIVILGSIYGMMNGEEWAETGWGADNVLAHDAAYEEMWALHIMPLGVMAILTGITVTGKELARMALYSPVVLVIILGGMGVLTSENGYGGTPEGIGMLIPILMLLATVLTGIAGYMHKDG
ncbi:MAG: hypothetical protein CMB47_03045 [Euryarchaeota archaeon]|nr:hypothetical protein [Euryarchaeota archaeon]|tara:strand:- start:5318 stop:5839 length:522 start_codon:yes stop_codon:yes gene_type:complete